MRTLDRFVTRRRRQSEYVIKDGKTYVEREGRLIEIKTLDSEINAKAAATKAKRTRRLVAFPWSYLVDVCRRTKGRAPLVVAEYIYRRAHVCESRTVTLPSAELVELGISPSQKSRALTQLAHANFIRIEEGGVGRTSRVTLLWEG